MKTIALTLFAAALGLAQNSTSPGTTPGNTPASTPARTPGQRAAAQRAAQNAARNAASSSQYKKPAQPSKPSPDQKTKAPSPTPSIPAGATLVEPNLYRYTDSSGKTWNYRQTPFGITRWEEGSAPASQLNPQVTKSEPVTVTDLGDRYRFQRKTPFGESNWIRKKSELTDEEKALTVDPGTETVAPATIVAAKPLGNL